MLSGGPSSRGKGANSGQEARTVKQSRSHCGQIVIISNWKVDVTEVVVPASSSQALGEGKRNHETGSSVACWPVPRDLVLEVKE